LGEGEAEDGDRLQATLRLGLAGDTVDVGGEDETDSETRTHGREAVTEHVERAVHGFFLSLFPDGFSWWVLRLRVGSWVEWRGAARLSARLRGLPRCTSRSAGRRRRPAGPSPASRARTPS